jgi:hypothetical protein
MKELLLEMKAEVERAKANGQSELDLLVLAHLLCRYDEILAEGYRANPPPEPPRKSAQGKRKPGRARTSARPAICWIVSRRESGKCFGSSKILSCLLITIRQREICV